MQEQDSISYMRGEKECYEPVECNAEHFLMEKEYGEGRSKTRLSISAYGVGHEDDEEVFRLTGFYICTESRSWNTEYSAWEWEAKVHHDSVEMALTECLGANSHCLITMAFETAAVWRAASSNTNDNLTTQ